LLNSDDSTDLLVVFSKGQSYMFKKRAEVTSREALNIIILI